MKSSFTSELGNMFDDFKNKKEYDINYYEKNDEDSNEKKQFPLEECSICYEKKNLIYHYSCTHVICAICLYRTIFCRYISQITNKKEIININCKHCGINGTLERSLDEILDLIKIKNSEDKNYIIQKDYKRCKEHNSSMKDQFCTDCNKRICKLCGLKDMHINHRIIKNDKLLNLLKKQKKLMKLSIKNKESFTSILDRISNMFKNTIEDNIIKLFKDIDNLIASAIQLRTSLEKYIQKELKRTVKIIKILKLYYLNYFNEEEKTRDSIDSEILQFINDVSMELQDMKITTNKVVMQKVKEMKREIDTLRMQINNYINVEFDFNKISRDFETEDIILKTHDASKGKNIIPCVIQDKEENIITANDDNKIKIWKENFNAEYNNEFVIHNKTGIIYSLYMLEDGRLCTSSHKSKCIRLWKKDNEGSYTICGSLGGINEDIKQILQFNNKTILSVSTNNKIIVWKENSLTKEYELDQIKLSNKGNILTLSILQKGTLFAVGYDNGAIDIWEEELDIEREIKLRETLILQREKKGICCVVYSDRVKGIVSGGESGDIVFYRENKKKFCLDYMIEKAHKGKITTIVEMKDKRIASCAIDHKVCIWEYDESNGQFMFTQSAEYINELYNLKQLKDGRLIAFDKQKTMVFFKERKHIY